MSAIHGPKVTRSVTSEHLEHLREYSPLEYVDASEFSEVLLAQIPPLSEDQVIKSIEEYFRDQLGALDQQLPLIILRKTLLSILFKNYFKVANHLLDMWIRFKGDHKELGIQQAHFNHAVFNGQRDLCERFINEFAYDINTVVYNTSYSGEHSYPTTSLIAAVRRQDHLALELLLSLGADPHVGKTEKGSALDLAKFLKNGHLVSILKGNRATPMTRSNCIVQ